MLLFVVLVHGAFRGEYRSGSRIRFEAPYAMVKTRKRTCLFACLLVEAPYAMVNAMVKKRCFVEY